MSRKNFLKKLGFILLIAVFTEIFIFNFRFFKTIGNEEIIIDPNDIVYNKGLEYNPENRVYEEGEMKNKPSVKILDIDEASFEIKNINQKIENIYIDISNSKKVGYGVSTKKLTLEVWATDEANALYFSLPERDVIRDIEKSKYINFNLSGKSEKNKI